MKRLDWIIRKLRAVYDKVPGAGAHIEWLARHTSHSAVTLDPLDADPPSDPPILPPNTEQ